MINLGTIAARAILAWSLGVMLVLPSRAGVLSNDALVDDLTIAEWSAQWWKWILPIDINQNPFLDSTGASAAVGQPDGNVFLVSFVLGLSPDVVTVTRRFTVLEGKYLFFPLLMYETDNVDTFPPLTVEALRDQAAGVMNDVRELHASIDGVDIPNLFDHRVTAPVFNLFYQDADNVHTFAYGHPIVGLIDPMVCDGYWLMLEPLPPGLHVLHFGGSFHNPRFYPSDIVAYINVLPRPLAPFVHELIVSVEASHLGRNRVQPLLATLQGAEKLLTRRHFRAGLDHLRAFQNKVRHQIARIDPTLAEQFIQAAQQIIDRAEAEVR